METVNVLNQMAEYDFRAPINVEMIFEDSNDESSFQNAPSEQEKIKDNNNKKDVSVEKCEAKCLKDSTSFENQINHRGLNKPILSLNKINRNQKKKPIVKKISRNNAENNIKNYKNLEIRTLTNDVGHNHNQNKSNTNQNALIVLGDDTVNNEESFPGTCQINDHHEPVTFIKDLLNNLSEHIVLIMQSFYNYGLKGNPQDNKKRQEVFNVIKFHLFEMSYATVESIILPQEQNDSFIKQFIDNTVIIANLSKSLQWKCHRGHVQPFFKELVAWSKQRRYQIKENLLRPSNNENIILKQQLLRPLLPFNLPHSESVPKSNIATPKTRTNLCIFSTGTPGSEISINIDADTLMHLTERQCTTPERSGHHNAPSSESAKRNTTLTGPPYGTRVNDIQRQSQYDRPPPPFNMHHSSRNLTNRPQQYYYHQNMNPIQNYYPHQNRQNIRQTIQNYQNQVQYINTNQTSPSDHDSSNYLLYDNTNKNIPLHGMQLEKQITSSPVIRDVSSLNLRTQIQNTRCFMCGKNTSTPCAPYTPCRPTYCSYLCQELDSQIYKPGWET